jgi:hypothetical protein
LRADAVVYNTTAIIVHERRSVHNSRLTALQGHTNYDNTASADVWNGVGTIEAMGSGASFIAAKLRGGITSKSGAYTEPTLPEKTVVDQNGVQIEHYYKSGDHAPPHFHVKGGGTETKIGANGKPIKGFPELTKTQSNVVQENLSKIRSAGNKINQYQKYQNYLKSN